MISLNKTKGSRFSHKLETLFWWILRLLPIFIFLIYCFGASRSSELWSIVVDDGGDIQSLPLLSFTTIYNDTLGFVPSSFFRDVFSPFFRDGVFPLVSLSSCGVFDYLCYCIVIEIVRMMYNVIVFIPRLAHKWISNAIQDD